MPLLLHNHTKHPNLHRIPPYQLHQIDLNKSKTWQNVRRLQNVVETSCCLQPRVFAKEVSIDVGVLQPFYDRPCFSSDNHALLHTVVLCYVHLQA